MTMGKPPKPNSEVNTVIDLVEVRVTPRDPLSVPVAHAARQKRKQFRSTETGGVVLSSLSIGDYDAGDSGFRQARFVRFSAKAFTLVRHTADQRLVSSSP